MSLIHGETRNGLRSPEWLAWKGMIQRCHLPTDKYYPRYGGRGIQVCGEWRNSFLGFLRHIGRKPSPKHSLDRIDNNRGYEPGNVRWATRRQQARNTRLNRFIVFRGERHCLKEWSEITGIGKTILKARLDKGWPIERALTHPPVHNRNKTHCAYGHPLSGSNVYSNKHHPRLCMTCRELRKQKEAPHVA